jgi:hypothetical protein
VHAHTHAHTASRKHSALSGPHTRTQPTRAPVAQGGRLLGDAHGLAAWRHAPLALVVLLLLLWMLLHCGVLLVRGPTPIRLRALGEVVCVALGRPCALASPRLHGACLPLCVVTAQQCSM